MPTTASVTAISARTSCQPRSLSCHTTARVLHSRSASIYTVRLTPEERLDRIETTLDRASRMYEKMNVRHAGIRTLYRQGVNRFEEVLAREEHLDALLAALMDSQLRTEE